MVVHDDQTKWRMVFQHEPTSLQVTTWPEPDQPHTVVQPDPAELKCTITRESEDAIQVKQGTGVTGIWPPPEAERVRVSNYVAGVNLTVIYTVPAGKKLYITSSLLASGESADADSLIRLHVENQASAVKYFLQFHYYMIAGQQISGEYNSPALLAFATDKVAIECFHANIKGRGKFEGWLEDV